MKKSILALSLSMVFATSLFTACGGSSSDADDYDGYNPSSGRSGGKGEFFKTGSMVDPRDGTTYKTVKIGDQVWMAENLAFYDTLGIPELAKAPSSDYSGWSGDFMPVASIADSEEMPAAKEPSGQTYTYDAAMNFGYYSDTSYNDGICPPGWHLPVMAEFDVLKGVLQSVCDSVSECSMAEEGGWKNAETYWTSNPADGVRINSDHGYSYRSNSYDAVSYTVNVEDFNEFAADFSGKSSKFNVRCVQGAVADSASALKSFMTVREKNVEAKRLADSVWNHVLLGAKAYFNPALNYGEFVDSRDGETYGYLQIGNYIWMAENMRHYYKLNDYYFYSDCDSYLSCEARTYEDTVAYYATGVTYPDSMLDQVCPLGWHVSTKAEWEDLLSTSEDNGSFLATDGKWPEADNIFNYNHVTNSTGFTAMATTRKEEIATNETYFWTSSDSVKVTIMIDTVYVDSLVPVDTLPVVDTVAVSDSIPSDTVLPEPEPIVERAFFLDTTRTEYKYHYYVQYYWFHNGFEFDVSSEGRYYVRCVMDY